MDFRKRERRNVFFLLQAVPFFILAVLITLMVSNGSVHIDSDSADSSNHAERYGGGGVAGNLITGNIIDIPGMEAATGGCSPDWVYGSWSNCVNGIKYRNKIDINNCSENMIENQSCQGCTSNWSCAWQQCSVGNSQQKICTDFMGCDPSNISYVLDSRSCCIERWKANFGSCVGGVEAINYQDLNNCDTEFLKPPVETRPCGNFLPELFSKWYFWAVIVLILIITFLLLFFLVIRKRMYGYGPISAENSTISTEVSTTEEVEEQPKTKHGKAGKAGSKSSAKTKGAKSAKAAAKSSAAVEYPVELVSYVQAAMAAGASKEEVRAKLHEVGWKEEVVNAILEGL